MKISVITVSYNSEMCIGKTIDSVNKQTYQNVEHIFIDGASQDKTLEIISEMCERHKVIVSGPDNGVYDAMNRGLARATGDIICFLNSDDFFMDDDVLEEVALEFTHAKVNYIWGNILFVDRINTGKVKRYWKSKFLDKYDILNAEVAPHPGFFFDKKVAKKHPSFDLAYAIAADFDYIKKVILDDDFTGKYLDRYMVKMRVGGLSTSNNSVKQNKEVFHSLKSSFPRYGQIAFLYRRLKTKCQQSILRGM
jgi:glycosyltransferase